MRMGSGMVTRAAPASQVAWIPVISFLVVGPSNATWSPGPTPWACSTAAARRASACSCGHGIVVWSSPLTNVMSP